MMNKILIYIPVVLLSFLAGVLFKGQVQKSATTEKISDDKTEGNVSFYTCSMHPSVKLMDPKGKCPICAMDLIPVTSGAHSAIASNSIFLSERAVKLAEIETTPVERKFVTTEIRMVGKVEYDETRLSTITAWVPGRLERLYVDYTGVGVNQGDHLVDLYSPDLISAQEELLQAIQTAESLKLSDSDFLRQKSLASVESTKEKLRLWGVSDEQIQTIAAQGRPSERITINSPISGIVVQKKALEGMYVETGTQVYTIADLSKVWVKLDAYESDLPWLHYGQDVEFRTEAYPGEIFRGQVAFIDPILNANTRTIKIRVNLSNPDGKLKPDMFVRATVKSQVARGGRVMNPNLMGKWISPMHPEIVKDGPGSCDICGMDLVSAESMGYVSAEHPEDEAPLVIPASAPLITGKRAVVYVATEPGHFEGRVVELGPRAGDYYIVHNGLLEGEEVVNKGNFKIDSAVQIQAKPSMMNPHGEETPTQHHHSSSSDDGGAHHPRHQQSFKLPAEMASQWTVLLNLYNDIQVSLSRDQSDQIQSLVRDFDAHLAMIDSTGLKANAKTAWDEIQVDIERSTKSLSVLGDILEVRKGFGVLSKAMIHAFHLFDSGMDQPLYVYHCPMAFKGEGGDWIQMKQGVENPYFGSSMFTCGELKETLIPKVESEVEHLHE